MADPTPEQTEPKSMTPEEEIDQNMENPVEKKFIIWDTSDGRPTYDEDFDPPRCTSAGVTGVLELGNCYLTAYAAYLDKPHTELDINEATRANFSLSGESKIYEVIRIA